MSGPSSSAAFAIEALGRSALFARVSPEALAACAASLRVRRYRRGETIFHQGDPGDSLYIVESGSVKIVLPSPEGEEGAIIATLGRGDFFGELALLDGEPHSATAVAGEAVSALILQQAVFAELLETQPGLRHALIAGLVAELRRLTNHVEDLHFLDLPGRLANRIVRLARESHPGESRDVHLEWRYTQSELGAMIGGTRQTVNRLLADLTAQGLLSIEGEELVIPDVDALARAADR
jgi:CRP/FNR family transcriptional regulator, cyclic AMP receptor protein